MPKFYDVDTNEPVTAEKVKEPHIEVVGKHGTILITEGNYKVEYGDGNIVGVHAEDFTRRFSTTKNKDIKTGHDYVKPKK